LPEAIPPAEAKSGFWGSFAFQASSNSKTAGVADLVPLLDDAQVQYALIRLPPWEDEPAKDIFLTWVGPKVSQIERGKKSEHLADAKEVGIYDESTGMMIINTEWGSFDNALSVLPNNKYDISLDKDTPNPGIQMFEKRISGMYLGEILRRALVSMLADKEVPLFEDGHSAANLLHTSTFVNQDSALHTLWGLDSSFLSTASADTSDGLRITRQAIHKDMAVHAPRVEDAEAVQLIAKAVGRRAARLAAVAIGAIVIASDELKKETGEIEDDVIDIGVDGSLVEFYPGFEEHIREALRDVPEIGEKGEKRIRIGIAKDGSGVGAALIALIAGRALRRATTL